jgi:hypothetical protein
LEYTPQELSAILFYHISDENEVIKLQWERTRIQTYFIVSTIERLIAIITKRKNKILYKKFCKDIWPFVWEKTSITQEISEEEEMMNITQWHNILNKPVISSRKLDDTESIALIDKLE